MSKTPKEIAADLMRGAAANYPEEYPIDKREEPIAWQLEQLGFLIVLAIGPMRAVSLGDLGRQVAAEVQS